MTTRAGIRAGCLGDGLTLAGGLKLTEDQLSYLCVEYWASEQQASSGDLVKVATTKEAAAHCGLKHKPLPQLENERTGRSGLSKPDLSAPGAGRRLTEVLDSERPPAADVGTPEPGARPTGGEAAAEEPYGGILNTPRTESASVKAGKVAQSIFD